MADVEKPDPDNPPEQMARLEVADDTRRKASTPDELAVLVAVHRHRLPWTFLACTHINYTKLLTYCGLPEDRMRVALKGLLRAKVLVAPHRRIYGVSGEQMHCYGTEVLPGWIDLGLDGAALEAAIEREKRDAVERASMTVAFNDTDNR